MTQMVNGLGWPDPGAITVCHAPVLDRGSGPQDGLVERRTALPSIAIRSRNATASDCTHAAKQASSCSIQPRKDTPKLACDCLGPLADIRRSRKRCGTVVSNATYGVCTHMVPPHCVLTDVGFSNWEMSVCQPEELFSETVVA